MSFPRDVVKKAWRRAKGCCESCGKQLAWSNRGRYGRGSWEPHHILPRADGGGNRPANCAILCTGRENCHLTAGHNGDYSQRGSFNRLSNSRVLRGLGGAVVGARFGGPVGAIVGGVIGAISAPDLTKD